MKKRRINLSKKVLVISILVSIILLASIIIYALDSYNSGYRLDQEVLTVHYGDASGTTSPTTSCWKLTNTGSNDYFIPTKTSAEMAAFIANKPADVTYASAVQDETCTAWASCSVNDATCANQNRCAGTLSGVETCTSCIAAQCGGSTGACAADPCSVTCTSGACGSGEACIGISCVACSSLCSSYSGSYYCGTTFWLSPPCSGTSCSGTACIPATSVSCGTTYTACGCNVVGQLCGSGTCTVCSSGGGCSCTTTTQCSYPYGAPMGTTTCWSSPGCNCIEGICEYDYGQSYSTYCENPTGCGCQDITSCAVSYGQRYCA